MVKTKNNIKKLMTNPAALLSALIFACETVVISTPIANANPVHNFQNQPSGYHQRLTYDNNRFQGHDGFYDYHRHWRDWDEPGINFGGGGFLYDGSYYYWQNGREHCREPGGIDIIIK